MGLTLQNYLITLIVTKQVLKTAFPARYKVKIIFLDLLTELTAQLTQRFRTFTPVQQTRSALAIYDAGPAAVKNKG